MTGSPQANPRPAGPGGHCTGCVGIGTAAAAAAAREIHIEVVGEIR